MRIFADENVQSAIVKWLRAKGHDVVWAAEECPSDNDESVLASANSTARIVLTRDKDFGSLVFRDHLAAYRVILLRIHAKNQIERLEILRKLWPEVETKAVGDFVVVSNKNLRVRKLGSIQ